MEQQVEFGNLYDVNKNLVENYEKPLSPTALREKLKMVKQYILSHNHYFMLLCHEKRDYTLFRQEVNHSTKAEMMIAELKECLENRGKIKGIDKTQDGAAIEIWISSEGESSCYYFFPYDSGVIEI